MNFLSIGLVCLFTSVASSIPDLPPEDANDSTTIQPAWSFSLTEECDFSGIEIDKN